MIVGILSEPKIESRVVLTPEVVQQLKTMNADIWVEENAGIRALFSDEGYLEAGAEIKDKKSILKKADLLLKISAFSADELSSISENQVVIASMNPFQNKELVKLLSDKQFTSFSMELVPRVTRAQAMDVLSSMATVAGYKAVLDAAMHLPRFFPMFMSASGTIKPAKILILGAGVAGLQAVAIARKLGAVVEVFDVRSAVKEEVKSLGGKFIEVEGATEDAAAGGYAVEQSEDFKKKQAELIHAHAVSSDVLICTAQIPGRKAPVLIRKETVSEMKKGSVVIDLAASTGGNCELTQDGKAIVEHEVTIIGKSDYPSDMSIDASSMYAKNMFNFLKLIIDEQGNLNLNFEDEIVKGTCLTHKGEIVNDRVKSMM